VPELPEGAKGGHVVLLDGRAMATPFGNLMVVPSRSLAVGLAGEWAAQQDRIKPALMPLMTLCTTALDIVPTTKLKTVNDIVKFLTTDTVAFFADASEEPGLREMQEEAFPPAIEWFERRFGVKLVSNLTRTDLGIAFAQPPEAAAAVRDQVAEMNDWELSVLDRASGEAKSTVLATMLCAGALSARDALEACKTEERYQMTRWGDIPHWHGIDFGLTRTLLSASQFYSLCLREDGVAPRLTQQ
jgi:chaperone required for assembly of F1-ATPase